MGLGIGKIRTVESYYFLELYYKSGACVAWVLSTFGREVWYSIPYPEHIHCLPSAPDLSLCIRRFDRLICLLDRREVSVPVYQLEQLSTRLSSPVTHVVQWSIKPVAPLALYYATYGTTHRSIQ